MTLHNHARHLREAIESLLSQTHPDFALLMLDDGSTDATETIAREYEQRDGRVRYFRNAVRQGMVTTWREVAELAAREFPTAEYFAWASDHDRWHPDWLARMTGELDRHEQVVLAYPLCNWIDDDGVVVTKRSRRFTTVGMADRRARWSHFCRNSVGAGDMVYGLIRIPALRAAGTFRLVLRPDRLLVAELTLLGEISQVEEVLWTRRQGPLGSVARQGDTLTAAPGPWWFWLPPWVQHARVLLREHSRRGASPAVSRVELWRMVLLYEASYTWRHIRRSGVSHGVASLGERVQAVRKGVRHWSGVSRLRARHAGRQASARLRRQLRRARHEVPLATRALSGRVRRACRHGVRDALVLTRRLGLRGGSSERE